MENAKTLALFDFDNTLISTDSFYEFALYFYGRFGFSIKALPAIPVFALHKLGVVRRDKAKEAVFSKFYKGIPIDVLKEKALQFTQDILLNKHKPEALDAFKAHLERGHRVVVVSASMDIWLAPWAEQQGVELICTNTQVVRGQMTGNFSSPNCNYDEKAKRVRQLINLNDYEKVYVYGDSGGDKSLLELATHPFYRSFPRPEEII